MRETFQLSGTNPEMGPVLSGIFQQAGLPAPSMRTETLLGADEWMVDVLRSLRPQIAQFNLSAESLGDFETLRQRLKAELAASNSETPLPALVSAWSRKSAN